MDRLSRLRSSIELRVVLATAVVGLAILLAASTTIYQQNRRAAADSVAETLVRASKMRARSVSLWFAGRQMLVEMARDEVARSDGRDLERAFRHKVLTDNFVGTYFGAQADGAFVNYPRIRNLPPGYDPRQRPWYQAAAMRRATVLIEPYPDASLAERVVTVATPLMTGGRLVGVTAADFPIRALADMLEGNSINGSYSFIVNDRGTVLVHPDARLVGRPMRQLFDGRTPSLRPVVNEMRQGGVDRLVAFAPVPDLPSAHWYVGIALDRNVAYRGVVSGALRSILLTAIVLSASLLMIWFVLSRLVLRPLRRIVRDMKRIAAGELDIVLRDTERQDEVGAMARAVEVFRGNGLRIAELTQAEAERLGRETRQRAEMMSTLRRSFGLVVDAAVAGDFSGRVEDGFADPELNALARSINMLVDTIDRGLSETGRVLAALARTDLTLRVEGDFQGAFAKLKTDTNAVANTLDAAVGKLREMSRQLKDATGDLTSETRSLSDRTRSQQTAVQGTAHAIQRLTQTVEESSSSVEAASHRAREAAVAAEAGSDVMVQALAAMARLNTSSGTISGIITMLDAIASETALLALNASIEAARAGESGRGFAVVATEVKTLAAKAAQASSEANRLVRGTLSDIEAGSGMIARVSEDLSAMRGSVRENHSHLQMIFQASREQAASIEEISAAMDQLDRIARDNASLVEELRTTTAKTESHASQMDALVYGFHSGERRRTVRGPA